MTASALTVGALSGGVVFDVVVSDVVVSEGNDSGENVTTEFASSAEL